MADHPKWDLVGVATIMPLSAAHMVVTDTGRAAAAEDELRSQVPDLVTVAPR